jgi:hypothetical protein
MEARNLGIGEQTAGKKATTAKKQKKRVDTIPSAKRGSANSRVSLTRCAVFQPRFLAKSGRTKPGIGMIYLTSGALPDAFLLVPQGW